MFTNEDIIVGSLFSRKIKKKYSDALSSTMGRENRATLHCSFYKPQAVVGGQPGHVYYTLYYYLPVLGMLRATSSGGSYIALYCKLATLSRRQTPTLYNCSFKLQAVVGGQLGHVAQDSFPPSQS